MILRDVAQWLLDNKYAVLVNGEFTITSKLTKELTLKEVKTTKKGIGTDEDRRKFWAEFVAECEIPWIKSTTAGNYYLRPYSVDGIANLLRVLNKPGIIRRTLIEATKKYYRESAFPKTLLNYLRDELWEEAYNSYLANPQSSTGLNPFEV